MKISAFQIPHNQGPPIFPDLIVFDVIHPDLLQNELYAYDSEINAALAKELFEELEYTVTIVPPPEKPIKQELPAFLKELSIEDIKPFNKPPS
jgi:hypothetical protein